MFNSPSTGGTFGMLARRSTRFARQLSVAGASLAIVGSAIAYAVSPATEAIGASITAITSVANGNEAIHGRVLQGTSQKAAKGTTVKVTQRVRGRDKVVGTAKVDSTGGFSIPVPPGTYNVVISHASGTKSQKTVAVTVAQGKQVFVAATLTKSSAGWSIAPVIFNY